MKRLAFLFNETSSLRPALMVRPGNILRALRWPTTNMVGPRYPQVGRNSAAIAGTARLKPCRFCESRVGTASAAQRVRIIRVGGAGGLERVATAPCRPAGRLARAPPLGRLDHPSLIRHCFRAAQPGERQAEIARLTRKAGKQHETVPQQISNTVLQREQRTKPGERRYENPGRLSGERAMGQTRTGRHC